jgi:hypothetical protein
MSERAATMDAVDCVCTALRALIAMHSALLGYWQIWLRSSHDHVQYGPLSPCMVD